MWGRGGKLFEENALELRIIVGPGGGAPTPPVYRAQAHLMSAVSDAENFAVCDYTRNFAFCRLNQSAASNREFVAYYYLQALVNFSLTQLHLTPVHAACVARNGRGVLLCGESGAGKTSLAYRCARDGWTYVSDNESWLVRGRQALLVGDPRRIRFRETAVELFPELHGRPAKPHPNGKMSIEIETSGIATAGSCEIVRVVFLSRGPARLQPFPAQQTVERLLSEIPIYEDHVRQAHRTSLEKIALLDPVELRYSQLDDGARSLEDLLK